MISRLKEIWQNWRQKDYRNEYRIRERYDPKRGVIWYHAEFREWNAFAWRMIDFELRREWSVEHINRHSATTPSRNITPFGKLP